MEVVTGILPHAAKTSQSTCSEMCTNTSAIGEIGVGKFRRYSEVQSIIMAACIVVPRLHSSMHCLSTPASFALLRAGALLSQSDRERELGVTEETVGGLDLLPDPHIMRYRLVM